jgi:hypothetical protein
MYFSREEKYFILNVSKFSFSMNYQIARIRKSNQSGYICGE